MKLRSVVSSLISAPLIPWARVAVWDVAANGAFVNPIWR